MKNILITGAGRGIGLALTKEFAGRGNKVIATYRDSKTAGDLLRIAQETPGITAVTVDVADESTFGPLKELLGTSGRIDILVNNAGVIGDKEQSLFKINVDKMADVFEVNTFGPLRVCQLVLPFMGKAGTVAQITSQMGSIADNSSGGYYDYRMSKAALNMFNMCLAKEFTGITCLSLHPGWVQTDMGGAGASVSVEDSARGLYKVIVEATPKQTGTFLTYRGEELPW